MLRYWQKFTEYTKKEIIKAVLDTLTHNWTDEHYESLQKFLRLPFMANTFHDPKTRSTAPRILSCLLYRPHPKVLDTLKVIVETQEHIREWMGSYVCVYQDRVPEVWYALENNHRVVVEYLIMNDMWTMQCAHTDLATWGEKRCAEGLDFVDECRRKYNKI